MKISQIAAVVKVKETDCTRDILDFLTKAGCYVWRNNSGAIQGKHRFIKYGKPGSSDIIGISPTGIFMAIEVKSNGEPLTKEKDKGEDSQEFFLKTIARKAGISIIAKSLQDVVGEYERTGFRVPSEPYFL